MLRERFHVTPKVGVQFSGVLVAEDRIRSVYADVVAYPEDGVPEKVQGETYLRHDNLSYVQRLINADE